MQHYSDDCTSQKLTSSLSLAITDNGCFMIGWTPLSSVTLIPVETCVRPLKRSAPSTVSATLTAVLVARSSSSHAFINSQKRPSQHLRRRLHQIVSFFFPIQLY
jgi:hypothetical protein